MPIDYAQYRLGDLLQYLGDDLQTRRIVIFMESIGDAVDLLEENWESWSGAVTWAREPARNSWDTSAGALRCSQERFERLRGLCRI